MNFAQAWAEYERLRQAFAQQRLRPDEYARMVGGLQVRDASGAFWRIDGATGRWLRFNGTTWEYAIPPMGGQPVAAPGFAPPGGRVNQPIPTPPAPVPSPGSAPYMPGLPVTTPRRPTRNRRRGTISIAVLLVFLLLVLLLGRTIIPNYPEPNQLAWAPATTVYLVQGTTPSVVDSPGNYDTEPRSEVYWAVRTLAGLGRTEFTSLLFIHTGRAPVTIIRSAQAARAYSKIEAGSLRKETIGDQPGLIVNRPAPRPLVADPTEQWGAIRLDDQTLLVGATSGIAAVLDVRAGRAKSLAKARPELVPLLQSFRDKDEALIQILDNKQIAGNKAFSNLVTPLVPGPVRLIAGPAAEAVAMASIKRVDPRDCSAAYIILFASEQSAATMENVVSNLGLINRLFGGNGWSNGSDGVGNSTSLRIGNMVRINLYLADPTQCALQTR